MTSRRLVADGATNALLATLLCSLAVIGPSAAWAQDVVACVHDKSGVIYLKDATKTGQCAGNDGEIILSPGVSDHGELDGLADDDHPQYVLVDGVRDATDGLAVTGTSGIGVIPAEGPGVRMMWYPGKAAFRAGRAFTTVWDDANVGNRSVAMGNNTVASGFASTALGTSSIASGGGATAMGVNATASGSGSTALGRFTTASGLASVAMGRKVSTNGHDGSFIFGDNSTGLAGDNKVVADNSFVVRAQRVYFGKVGDQGAFAGQYIGTSTGAYLSDGGAWTDASSRLLKENFLDEDAEAALAKVARLPVRSWNYRAEDPSVRHLGPTAEDFHAAFELGDDESIASLDVGGVTLLAVQALAGRTRALRQENATLRQEVGTLQEEVGTLRQEIEGLALRLLRLNGATAGFREPITPR